MDPARIASLLTPFLAPDSLKDDSLTGRQLTQVSTYLDLLLKWNARINLTSVRQPEEIVTRHFGESFFTARRLFHSPVVIPSERDQALLGGTKEREPRDPGFLNLIDVGSGAGFPGLPIKIYAPALPVTLVESNQKKATFLREVIRALTFTNVDVFSGRAEDFPGAAAIVTLRAVEKPERALPAAARLVAPGGRLALLLGASQAGDTQGLLPGFSWAVPVTLPGSSHRILLIGVNQNQEST
jgi:16S rRNA (guanine527-N7)-methyltransferase